MNFLEQVVAVNQDVVRKLNDKKITESVEKTEITILSEKQFREGVCTRVYDSGKSSTKFADYSLAKEELPEGKNPLTYISTIEADFEKVSNYLQKDPVQKVTIYLVDHDIWDGSELEYGYWIENEIVTTPKEVESGHYLAPSYRLLMELNQCG